MTTSSWLSYRPYSPLLTESGEPAGAKSSQLEKEAGRSLLGAEALYSTQCGAVLDCSGKGHSQRKGGQQARHSSLT